jgi:hypothetical protein
MHLIAVMLAVLTPEFTVLYSAKDPGYSRNFTHPDFRTAPRYAVRWKPSNTLDPFAAAEKATPADFTLATELTNDAVTWHLTAKRAGYFSVA